MGQAKDVPRSTPCIRLATNFAPYPSHISLVMSEIFLNIFLFSVENCATFFFSTGISTGTGSDTVNGTGKRISVGARENTERWPLLTLETEANGDSTCERGPSFVGSLGSTCR
jgi:hypothetical protein